MSRRNIVDVRVEALKLAYGTSASSRFTDRENLETIASAMRFRPEAPIVQRRRWELAFEALHLVKRADAVYESGDSTKEHLITEYLATARIVLEAHCGLCLKGERCAI